MRIFEIVPDIIKKNIDYKGDSYLQYIYKNDDLEMDKMEIVKMKAEVIKIISDCKHRIARDLDMKCDLL
jgi:hypothetical protein